VGAGGARTLVSAAAATVADGGREDVRELGTLLLLSSLALAPACRLSVWRALELQMLRWSVALSGRTNSDCEANSSIYKRHLSFNLACARWRESCQVQS
jgi:hypothetical protein